MKEKIRQWYRQGLWTAQMVKNAVGKVLTESEAYSIITEKEETAEWLMEILQSGVGEMK